MALTAQYGKPRTANRLLAYSWEQHVGDALSFIESQFAGMR